MKPYQCIPCVPSFLKENCQQTFLNESLTLEFGGGVLGKFLLLHLFLLSYLNPPLLFLL